MPCTFDRGGRDIRSPFLAVQAVQVDAPGSARHWCTRLRPPVLASAALRWLASRRSPASCLRTRDSSASSLSSASARMTSRKTITASSLAALKTVTVLATLLEDADRTLPARSIRPHRKHRPYKCNRCYT